MYHLPKKKTQTKTNKNLGGRCLIPNQGHFSFRKLITIVRGWNFLLASIKTIFNPLLVSGILGNAVAKKKHYVNLEQK